MLPEAQPGYAAYLVCATQWRSAGMGARTGLDYTACLRLLETYLPRWQATGGKEYHDTDLDALMQDLQLMEMAILQVDAERRDSEQATRDAAHATIGAG